MKTKNIFLLSLAIFCNPGWAAELEETVSRAAGQSATTADDGVVRITWSRDDVEVEVDGIKLPPAAGLGSWAAFKPAADHVMVMGDMVVFEDEMTIAMDAAFAHGLEVTGIHNHFIYDDPPVYFMHIGGMGDASKLAEGVKAVWDGIKAKRAETPMPVRSSDTAETVVAGEMDQARLEAILGVPAEGSAEVNKFTFPKMGQMHGIDIGGSMGLTTWAAFIGSDDNAAVGGDFMMAANEVQTVLRTLREKNIHIVALHNHMVGENPTSYFLHYWGRGPAVELAEGITAAIEAQKGVNSGQ